MNGGERAGVAPVEEIVQRIDEIAAQRAAQAAGIERDDFARDPLVQQMIEADLAPFVDDDEAVGQRRRAEHAVDQARLAGAKEAGDDMDRNRVLPRQGSTGSSLPTNTGGPEGLPSGEPPLGSTVTA